MASTTNSGPDQQAQVHRVGGIGAWLSYHAAQNPQRTALIFEDRRLSYGVFNGRCNRLAGALAARGVGKGDRVAALLLNGNAFLEALFACAKLGALFVPLNYRLSGEEVAFILEDAGARLVFYHGAFASLLADARLENTAIQGIRVDAEASDGDGRDKDEHYEALIEAGTNREPEIDIAPDDAALMMYTSGTTGRPKGAVLSHATLTWHCMNTMLSPLEVSRDDVVLTVAPLFHIGGLNIHTLPALQRGATVVILAQFDPLTTLQAIERDRATLLFMVPAMWQALSQVPDIEDFDLSSLASAITGGAPCPIPVIEFFQQRGVNFVEGFGLTETAPSICVLESEHAVRKNGSVGRPLMLTRLAIVDGDDRPVERGEVGELVVRGPNVFVGYWNRPEATAEAFRSGWFHTGDLARQDDDGFYYIVERKKDMLISGGENVYPAEVEQALYRHPKIREVSVIGIPDERWGEVPMAFVVVQPDEHLDLDELTDFCAGRLARFKTPRRLVELEALPRTATGKVLKRSLREQAAAQTS
jgi:fatty-acyl-CoA synthase